LEKSLHKSTTLLFTACWEIGAGMNQVNRIVETIIQILRVWFDEITSEKNRHQ
jgi:type I restriction enzyme R subunit